MPTKQKSDDFFTSVSLEFNLQNNRHALFPDLLEEELFAIGRVTVGFAYLESLILADTARMADARCVELPDDALSTSFKRRMRAWRKFIKKYRRGKPRERLIKIANRISACQTTRNRITHGLWSWDYGNPDRSTATTLRPSFQFTEHFDFRKLMAVGDQIGEINFELSYPMGKRQARAALAQRGFRMSRSFAHIATGKELPPSLVRERKALVPSTTRPWESGDA